MNITFSFLLLFWDKKQINAHDFLQPEEDKKKPPHFSAMLSYNSGGIQLSMPNFPCLLNEFLA